MSREVGLRMNLGSSVNMVVQYNSAMKEILDALMRDTGGTLDDVFRMAIGIAGSADDLEQEFTGFRWVTTDRKEGT